MQALALFGVENDPATVCKLLDAIAGSDNAKAARHDTILIAASEMIKAFEKVVVNVGDTLKGAL